MVGVKGKNGSVRGLKSKSTQDIDKEQGSMHGLKSRSEEKAKDGNSLRRLKSKSCQDFKDNDKEKDGEASVLKSAFGALDSSKRSALDKRKEKMLEKSSRRSCKGDVRSASIKMTLSSELLSASTAENDSEKEKVQQAQEKLNRLPIRLLTQPAITAAFDWNYQANAELLPRRDNEFTPEIVRLNTHINLNMVQKTETDDCPGRLGPVRKGQGFLAAIRNLKRYRRKRVAIAPKSSRSEQSTNPSTGATQSILSTETTRTQPPPPPPQTDPAANAPK